MNSAVEQRALRKQVLVARVTLQRLEAFAAAADLRESVRRPRVTIARVVRIASVALTVIQLVRTIKGGRRK